MRKSTKTIRYICLDPNNKEERIISETELKGIISGIKKAGEDFRPINHYFLPPYNRNNQLAVLIMAIMSLQEIKFQTIPLIYSSSRNRFDKNDQKKNHKVLKKCFEELGPGEKGLIIGPEICLAMMVNEISRHQLNIIRELSYVDFIENNEHISIKGE